jgi:PIN domain nuclease of toxin-antitoxin system
VSESDPVLAILDASAVLAWLYEEPGADHVSQYLNNSAMSTINLAEVMQKLRQNNTPAEAMAVAGTLAALQVRIVEIFTQSAAARSAEIWDIGRRIGLSLGDRCCLALTAEYPNAAAITTDRAWKDLPLAQMGLDERIICVR